MYVNISKSTWASVKPPPEITFARLICPYGEKIKKIEPNLIWKFSILR